MPISQLRKADGTTLSADFKYGYVLCQMPRKGTALHKKLTTPVIEPQEVISEKELRALDQKHSGTPEYETVIVNAIRRPSAIRNALLKMYGTTCRLCGCEGFEKKAGGRYAETHHMIELNRQAPNSLQSWNVIVVCPTCHKKLHHANVETEFLNPGWNIMINGEEGCGGPQCLDSKLG